MFSLSPRPRRVFERLALELHGRREPDGAEAYALFTGHLVVDARTGPDEVQVALSPDSLTALLAWLESAPPDPYGRA